MSTQTRARLEEATQSVLVALGRLPQGGGEPADDASEDDGVVDTDVVGIDDMLER